MQQTNYIGVFNGHGLKNHVDVLNYINPIIVLSLLKENGVKKIKFQLTKIIDFPAKVAFYKGVK